MTETSKTRTGESTSQRRAVLAAASAVVTFCWYAMPDVVRSRGARVALKTALVGATAAAVVATSPAEDADVMRERAKLAEEGASELKPVVLVAGGAALVASAALGVAGEKWTFARGERRRDEGKRWAHTPLAVALAVAAGVLGLVDEDKLVDDVEPGVQA